MNTYAFHATPAFNEWMDGILQEFTRDTEALLGDKLVALILGGGYGRGEGGIELIDEKECPYNDLDFTLVVKNAADVPDQALLDLTAVYAKRLKIHVDFSRPLTIEAIQNWPAWLMWHDLLNGHIIMSGPQNILTANAPERVKQHPPPIESLRLHLNRGAGLLWALRVVRDAEPEPDRGFVTRNYYKTMLAIGDAVLLSRGRFATPYRGRDKLFDALAAEDSNVRKLNLQERYREALTFKFSPHEFNNTTIGEAELLEEAQIWFAVLLDTESLRTGKTWANPQAYAADRMIREPEMNTLHETPKNILRNLRCGTLAIRHPREALYRNVTELLLNRPSDWEQRSAKVMKIWDRYN